MTLAAAATVIVRGFAGCDRRLGLLSVADFAALRERLPAPEGDEGRRFLLNEFDVLGWARTAEGAAAVLALSMTKGGADTTDEQAMGMGSIVDRATIATLIVGQSMTAGEPADGEDERGGGPGGPFVLLRSVARGVTGWISRSSSASTRPGSATPTASPPASSTCTTSQSATCT
ncbi:MAG: hypothetical protein AAFY08_15085 [Planctomycetota bacterium]